jgi:hypothetical protein
VGADPLRMPLPSPCRRARTRSARSTASIPPGPSGRAMRWRNACPGRPWPAGPQPAPGPLSSSPPTAASHAPPSTRRRYCACTTITGRTEPNRTEPTQPNAMQCNAMQCNAMQCNAKQCNGDPRRPCLALPAGVQHGQVPRQLPAVRVVRVGLRRPIQMHARPARCYGNRSAHP